MHITDLIAAAQHCKTDVDVSNLADTFLAPLEAKLPQLTFHNHDYNMEHVRPHTEDDYLEPYFQVDISLEVSCIFVITMCLELRNNKFESMLGTYYMKDGYGLSSQDWEIFDVEDPWDFDLTQNSDSPYDFDSDQLAQFIQTEITRHQIRIMRNAGVDKEVARHIAEQVWQDNPAQTAPLTVYEEAKANAKTRLAHPNPIKADCCVAILPTGEWAGVDSEHDVQFIYLTEWQLSGLNGLTDRMILELSTNMTEENINALIFDIDKDNAETYVELGGKL